MRIFENFYQIIILGQQSVIFIPFLLSVVTIFALLAYHFIFPKKNINPLILLFLLSIPAILNIFKTGTFQGGDLSNHTEYLRAFYQNLSFGIFVPRWAADFCAGNGCPVFIFSYILSYYFGSVFHLIGFSFLNSIKLVLAFSFIFSGIFMYLFIKEELNERAGVIAAIFYLFSPYHLIDLYFRASVGEVLSYVFIPLVFLFSRRLILQQNIRNFLFVTASIIFLLYSHSVTTFSTIPLLIGYDLIILKKTYKNFSIRRIFILALSYLTGIMLSAYYWLPAFFEAKYTWTAHNGPTDYIEPLQNYLYSPSRYGFLFQGNNAEYRLIVGYSQLLIVIITIFLLFRKRNLFNSYIKLLLVYLLIAFVFYFFLMQTYAKFFWDYFTFLNFFLMVWRLLVVIGFITAFIAGIIISKIKELKIIIVICFLTVVITMLNWGSRKMVSYNPNDYFIHSDEYTEYMISGDPFYEKLYRQRSQIKDLASLKYRRKSPIELISGNLSYKQIIRTPQLHEYIIMVNKDSVIKENTFYFPGWRVIANNKEITINYKNQKDIGKIIFILPKGLYDVKVIFTDTIFTFLGKCISLVSLIILVLSCIYIKISKKISNKKILNL